MSDNAFTSADLQRAMNEVARLEFETLRRNAENTRLFYESIPEHLRGHPLVAEMGYLVSTGTLIHPADAEDYRRRYEALLAEDAP
jgi:hypothetical protein